MKKKNFLIRNIGQLGENYCKIYLNTRWDKEKTQTNWWEGLKFFLSHSFMRGRRDELSKEYYYYTIECLNKQFSIDENFDTSYEKLRDVWKMDFFDENYILSFIKRKKLGRSKKSIKHEDFPKEVSEKNPIIKLLTTKRKVQVSWDETKRYKDISLGNEEDIMMILDVLNFICTCDDHKNIYSYFKDKITKSGLAKVYYELCEFRAIGDKIACFVNRDILLMNPEIHINGNDYIWAFPLDTWVKKIGVKMGYDVKDKSQIKNSFIEECSKFDVNPLKFAAGLWFPGFHSVDILLDSCLDRIRI